MTTKFALLLIHVTYAVFRASSADDLMVPINLTCVSKDWYDLQCSWCPEQQQSDTSWGLSYITGSTRIPKCSKWIGPNNCTCHLCGERGNRCVKSVIYNISITQTKGGRSRTTSFPIELIRQVKLSKVKNMRAQPVTKDSITVRWDGHKKLLRRRGFNMEYHVEITARTLNFSEKYDIGLSTSYSFADLRPNTKYDITVTSTSSESRYLSDPAVIQITTAQDVPETAPTIYPGSFRLVRDDATIQRKLRFYWKNIIPRKRNGKLVNCTVSLTGLVESGENVTILQKKAIEQVAVNCSRETAEIGLSALTNRSYEVQLKAFTKIGPSPVATWFIPNNELVPPYPLKVFAETIDNSAIKIKWQEPNSTSTQPLSYTIYQCYNPMDDHTSCQHITAHQLPIGLTQAIIQGKMDSQTRYTMSTENNNVSSGMMPGWMCVFSHRHAPSQVRFDQTEPEGPRKLSLVWDSLQHSCDVNITTGLAVDLEIDWCQTLNCSATGKKVKITGNAVSYTITDVKPYTNYTVSMAAVGKAGRGTKKERILTTGQETPSGPPFDISCEFSQDEPTSVTLSWRPPSEPQGEILQYTVRLTGDGKVTMNKTTTKTIILFPELKAYTEYTFRISAQTSIGYSPWSVTSCRTPMSAPSKVLNVKIDVKRPTGEFSEVGIMWKSPKNPNGPIIRYRVASYWFNDGKEIKTTHVRSANHSTTQFIDCSERHRQRAGFNITAVNALGMESPTTTEVRYICDSPAGVKHPTIPQKWPMVVGVISLVILLSIIVVCLRWCLRSLRAKYKLPNPEMLEGDLEDIPQYVYTPYTDYKYEISGYETSNSPIPSDQLEDSQDSGMDSDKSSSIPNSMPNTSGDSAAVSGESADSSGSGLVVYKTMAPKTQLEDTNQNHMARYVTSAQADAANRKCENPVDTDANEYRKTKMYAVGNRSSDGIEYTLTLTEMNGERPDRSDANGTVPYMCIGGSNTKSTGHTQDTLEYLSHSQFMEADTAGMNASEISTGNNSIAMVRLITDNTTAANKNNNNKAQNVTVKNTFDDDPGYERTVVHYGFNDNNNDVAENEEVMIADSHNQDK